MEGGSDFIEWLGCDVSVKILMFLDDPSDLVRVSAVSSSWRQFGELSHYYLSLLPPVSHVISIYSFIPLCLLFCSL